MNEGMWLTNNSMTRSKEFPCEPGYCYCYYCYNNNNK